MENKLIINEASVHNKKNSETPIFSCKATTKCFIGPNTGRFTQTEMHFILSSRCMQNHFQPHIPGNLTLKSKYCQILQRRQWNPQGSGRLTDQ